MDNLIKRKICILLKLVKSLRGNVEKLKSHYKLSQLNFL